MNTMNVCCVNCGTYFGEFIENNNDFCSPECEQEFITYLKEEVC